MKVGDAKKFLTQLIEASDYSDLNPRTFNINDTFILNLWAAFHEGGSAAHIKQLAEGFIVTEDLSVKKRIAILQLVSTVLSKLASGNVQDVDRKQLKGILSSYFV